ncbi:MAG TPA: hypothetical protein PKD45_15510 [Flavobacteriales bacterium]|nr:hypothetical protein [Flavobacteriales bacterium]
MTAARGMGRHGLGYSYDYVRYVLHGKRKNKAITALHQELVALRTPKTKKSR